MGKKEKKVDLKKLNEKQFKKLFKKADNYVGAFFTPAEKSDFENAEDGDMAVSLAVKCDSNHLKQLIEKLEIVLVKQELKKLIDNIKQENLKNGY